MKNFPRQLKHGSGYDMELDPTRLLLAFKTEQARDVLENTLAQVDLVLEDKDDRPNNDLPRPIELVNHTRQRLWVRSSNGKPIDQQKLSTIKKALKPQLDWIGPVYKLANAEGRGGLLCPFPNVLVVKPAAAAGQNNDEKLNKMLERYGLKEVSEKSRYLNDYRYYVIDDVEEKAAYEIQSLLLTKEKQLVSEAHFENMPMLAPLTFLPNDTLFAQQWNLNQIQAPAGWDISTGTNTITVCVFDCGCDMTHPDITYSPLQFNAGTGLNNGSPACWDFNHGTACAGIIAASLNNALGVAGVAGNCRIMSVAFLNSTDVECAAGINFAANNGARVISMSFGMYAPGEGFGLTGWNFAIIDPAIANAVNVMGCVLCAATGNENTGAVNRYPSRNPLVIACGASDQIDNRKSPASPDGENWWGSNFGQGAYNGAPTGVSVVAPGVFIPTTDRQGNVGYNIAAGAAGNYFLRFNGTSAATPHVAGLAALILGARPGLSNIQVRNCIENTADKVGAVAYAAAPGFPNGTRNQQMGYGRINVFRALSCAVKTIFKDLKDRYPDKVFIVEKPVLLDIGKAHGFKEKERIDEVKGIIGYENPEIFNPIIFERILERLNALEQAVFQGRAFIEKSERPEVGKQLAG